MAWTVEAGARSPGERRKTTTTGVWPAALAAALVLAVLVAVLAAGGCSRGPRPISVLDDAGREVSLERPPERIVSMAPANTEILFALGLGDKVVGVTSLCNYPPEVAGIEKVGDSFSPDYEKIVALNPDLVLAVGTADSQLVKGLEGYGLKVFVLQAESVADVADDIELVGKVTGAEDRARKVAGDLRARVDAVRKKLEPVADDAKPTVFWVLDGDLWTVGPGSFVDDLITQAGGRSIAGTIGLPYGQLSLETVLEADPDVIIIPVLDPSVPAALEAKVGWDTLTAVRNGRVYQVDPDAVSRPGPRIAEGLEEVAALLYPDVFGQ